MAGGGGGGEGGVVDCTAFLFYFALADAKSYQTLSEPPSFNGGTRKTTHTHTKKPGIAWFVFFALRYKTRNL